MADVSSESGPREGGVESGIANASGHIAKHGKTSLPFPPKPARPSKLKGQADRGRHCNALQTTWQTPNRISPSQQGSSAVEFTLPAPLLLPQQTPFYPVGLTMPSEQRPTESSLSLWSEVGVGGAGGEGDGFLFAELSLRLAGTSNGKSFHLSPSPLIAGHWKGESWC